MLMSVLPYQVKGENKKRAKKLQGEFHFFPKVANVRSHVLLKILSPYTEPDWQKVIKSNKEGIHKIDDLD